MITLPAAAAFRWVGLFLLDHAANQLQGTFGVDPTASRATSVITVNITPDHWTLEVLNAPDRALVWDDAPLFDNGQQVGTGWKAGRHVVERTRRGRLSDGR